MTLRIETISTDLHFGQELSREAVVMLVFCNWSEETHIIAIKSTKTKQYYASVL